jgi:hypothetical protein
MRNNLLSFCRAPPGGDTSQRSLNISHLMLDFRRALKSQPASQWVNDAQRMSNLPSLRDLVVEVPPDGHTDGRLRLPDHKKGAASTIGAAARRYQP